MVRVRFAPSPTGHLHIGNLRAAIFNWLFARHHGGKFLLRIEDTDLERSNEFYVKSILASLNWCDLIADEAPVIQSSRIDEHRKAALDLLERDFAYKCYCSQNDVRQRFGISDDQEIGSLGYDGYCFDRKDDFSDVENKPYIVRFRIPRDEKLSYEDAVHGKIIFDLNDFDDFVILRSNGSPTYNLVVVVDDIFMSITHVIRGEDHISNTPKQILLYKALGYSTPIFAHVPLILGSGGQRLSKRDAATSVLDYQKEGILADALCNYLVRLGWSHGDQEIFTRQELIELFDLQGVNKSGAAFDMQKLLWVNSMYIKNSTPENLLSCIEADVEPNLQNSLSDWSQTTIFKAILLYQSRVSTLKELVSEIDLVYTGVKNQSNIKNAITFRPESIALLSDLEPILVKIDPIAWSSDRLKAEIKDFCNKVGIKLPDIAKPLRVVLVGKTSTPGIFDLLELIGPKATLSRLHNFLQ